MAMASISSLLALLMMASVMTYTVKAAKISDHHLRWVPVRGGCEGSIEECMEMDMDMDMSRRILATSQYISYKALQRNTVPCSQRGASYYNCRPYLYLYLYSVISSSLGFRSQPCCYPHPRIPSYLSYSDYKCYSIQVLTSCREAVDAFQSQQRQSTTISFSLRI